MLYRVHRIGDNKKIFVETADLNFAKFLIKEEEDLGHKMELKVKRGSRWYKIKEEGK